MRGNEFKRCEAVMPGLHWTDGIGERFYFARDIEALLERGTRVYGRLPGPGTTAFKWYEVERELCTHTGLLIDVRPIAPVDTAASLLDAAIAFVDAQGTSNILPKLLRDARALLDASPETREK